MRVFSLFILFLFTGPAWASMKCQTGQVVRCLCEASYSMSCNNNTYNGQIKDDTKATSIQLSVFDPKTGITQSVHLENPPGGIRDYYAVSSKNEWVMQQFRAQGVSITSDTIIEAVSAEFPDNTVLYEDTDATIELEAPPFTETQDVKCMYMEAPLIAKTASCGNQGICQASVQCAINGHLVDGRLACLSKGPNCPTASECFKAQDTDVTKPGNSSAIYAPTSSPQKVSQ